MVQTFEGENFRGFQQNAKILPLKFFLQTKRYLQGISIPPCGRSVEYRRHPVTTTQKMVPPRLINTEQSVEILSGTCPTVSPLFLMATAYRFRGFSSSVRN